MSTTVFLAVIAAAFLHATWNAFVKGGADKLMSLTAVILGHVPPALVAIAVSPPLAAGAWPYLAVGIALHMGYQLFLIYAYRVGDLTQVYPIARGSAADRGLHLGRLSWRHACPGRALGGADHRHRHPQPDTDPPR